MNAQSMNAIASNVTKTRIEEFRNTKIMKEIYSRIQARANQGFFHDDYSIYAFKELKDVEVKNAVIDVLLDGGFTVTNSQNSVYVYWGKVYDEGM